jgi:hypothetical protein
MTSSSGTRVGPCAVLAPIGAGGMGTVYRARDALRLVARPLLPGAVRWITWAADGSVLGSGMGMQSTMWKFTREAPQ